MKKKICLILALALLSLSACGKAAEPIATPVPEPSTAPTSEPTPEPTTESTPEPTPIPNVEPVSTDEAWSVQYTAFLTENFSTLSAACYGYIAGIGFIDLDLDTVPEMLIFDAGASSSMGVQIFDIAEDMVELITASSVEVGSNFAGKYFNAAHYVDTNSFNAFRLHEAANGTLYFSVTSRNAADDMSYTELLRFGNRDSVLTVDTVACAQTAYDTTTFAELYTVYTSDDTVIDRNQYGALLKEDSDAADLGYEAKGAFLWDSDNYGTDFEGFSAMLSDAVAAYVPAI